LKKPWPVRLILGYAVIALGAFLAATVLGWLIGPRIDNYSYDTMLRHGARPPRAPQAVIVAIDDPTLMAMGGTRKLRSILATGLGLVSAGHPRVTAVDLILADPGDPREDQQLRDAMRSTPNLVLPVDLLEGRWETPLPPFRAASAALGHVYPDTSSPDGVMRRISLELASGPQRHWALAMQAFRLWKGAPYILESPDVVQVGSEVIPARRVDGQRPLRILYTSAPLPHISLDELRRNPSRAAELTGKAVFLGVTSLSAARDRVITPYHNDEGMHYMSGVEVHAQVFETLARGVFLTDIPDLDLVLLCAAIAVAAALIFGFLSGTRAYLAALLLLAAAHLLPFLLFQAHLVVPLSTVVGTAWFAISGTATWQHFAVRRQLRASEADRVRYQQTLQFVTHEMRTPLTAIQGSSELMGRYDLPEQKRKEFVAMINVESKRLARMIQTFLDVERLGAGQMELRHESFTPHEILQPCLMRVAPIAEHKSIAIHTDAMPLVTLHGDRELMEYAVYNLLTNAVKYSAAETEIRVGGAHEDDTFRLSVQDQGMGIEEKELPNIFQRFYRTRRAEASGEKGTGIGLSIVDQIVRQHHGRMDVTSRVGQGSCFTMILPAESVKQQLPPSVNSGTVRMEK
jgi:signal transduction histidine kinase